MSDERDPDPSDGDGADLDGGLDAGDAEGEQGDDMFGGSLDALLAADAAPAPDDPAGDDEQLVGLGSDEDDDATVEVPPFLLRLAELGLIDDDTAVAEIAATDGPTYYLGDHTDEEVDAILDLVETRRIRAVVDRAGQLSVHSNDEKKIEAAFDDLFGEDDETSGALGGEQPIRATDSATLEDEIEALASGISRRREEVAEQAASPIKKARWWSRKG